MITCAELHALLRDCAQLWGAQTEVVADEDGLRIGACIVRRGTPPVRWIVATPTRTRGVPSVVALLSTLRRALDIPPGGTIIPAQAPPQQRSAPNSPAAAPRSLR